MPKHLPKFTMLAFRLAMGAGLSALAPFAGAQSVAELKAQLEAVQKRLVELEQKQQTAAPANAVTGGDIPGSFKLPGSSTSVKLGGYVKLDALFNSKSTGVNSDGDQLLTPQLIPVGPGAGDNERKQLKLHARQSRFNVATSTPTTWGPLTTLIEVDFFGSAGNESVSNSHNLRLRHAYGALGGFSAGQFWTNLMNLPALPELLDFAGPVGNLFVRQPQVRWTQKFAGGEWAVSAENPEAVFAVPGTGTTFRADDDRYPDIIGRVSFDTRAGKYSIAGIARNVRVDSGAAPAAVADEWGAGLALSGLIPVGPRDDFRFTVFGGNGIGRYNAPGFYVDGVLDAAGGLSLPTVVGGYAAYRHFWTPALRSTLVLSASRADNPAGTFGTINKSDRSAHLNLIWSPWRAVNLGAELIHGQREIENGQSGSLNRVQLSAQYSF
jgi:hypothetical protein